MFGSSNGSADWIQKNGRGGDPAQQSEARENDYNLPIANVSRIMKKVLPDNVKISKEAKDAVQECVSEFIGFITSEASHKCLSDKRKTVNGDDLLSVMSLLGFDDYVDPLKVYLARYRELESKTRGSSRDGDGSKRDTTASTPEQNPQFAFQQPDPLYDQLESDSRGFSSDGDGSKRDTTVGTPDQIPQVNGQDLYFPFLQDDL